MSLWPISGMVRRVPSTKAGPDWHVGTAADVHGASMSLELFVLLGHATAGRDRH